MTGKKDAEFEWNYEYLDWGFVFMSLDQTHNILATLLLKWRTSGTSIHRYGVGAKEDILLDITAIWSGK